MKLNSVLRATACSVGLFLGLFGAATQAQTVAAPSAAADYRLGPGDILGAVVFQNPDLSLDVRVSEGGLISYPLIGSVAVGGQTLMEAQARIAQALRSGGFVRDPQVSLVLRQMRGHQVSVLARWRVRAALCWRPRRPASAKCWPPPAG